MSEHIEHKVDRTGWPAGPWDGEPDRVQFAHRGLACLLVRGVMGPWCGYVGVPKGHPDYGKDYGKVDVEAHGGLTYSNACQGHICHVPDAGMPADVWWLGFDCAHWDDFCPGMVSAYPGSRYLEMGCTYRDQAYAAGEVRQLAEQLAQRGTA